MNTKTCASCQKELPNGSFSKHKGGLRSRCRECCSADFKKWRSQNLEKDRQRHLGRWSRTPDEQKRRILAQQKSNRDLNRERIRVVKREHYVRNRDSYLLRAKKQAASNPQAVRDRASLWNKTNVARRREISLLSSHKRRAAIHAAPGSHTIDDLRVLFENHDWRCVYCGQIATSVDHVVPISRGGSDSPENLVPCCRSCNSRKNRRTPQEWRSAS